MNWEELDDHAKRMVVRMTGRLTKEEENKLTTEQEKALLQELLSENFLEQEFAKRLKYDGIRAFRRLQNRKKLIFWKRMGRVAALFLLALGVSLFLWSRQETDVLPQVSVDYGQVTLLLSSGESVLLENSTDVLDQGKRIEVRDGGLNYKLERSAKQKEEIIYNTLIVPRGAEYHVVLEDGTKVYLNADSRLKYPLNFSGDKREVYLEGEAWFEVTKDSQRPFEVYATDVKVRVYGTQFNVNTAKKNQIEIVLSEGSIGVQSVENEGEIKLQPGQLATWSRQTHQMNIEKVDVKRYIAWREGCFYFNDESLVEIMQALARWYDVEIEFRNQKSKDLHFSGHLKRYEDVRDILKTITEATKVTFEVKEKTIIIQ